MSARSIESVSTGKLRCHLLRSVGSSQRMSSRAVNGLRRQRVVVECSEVFVVVGVLVIAPESKSVELWYSS